MFDNCVKAQQQINLMNVRRAIELSKELEWCYLTDVGEFSFGIPKQPDAELWVWVPLPPDLRGGNCSGLIVKAENPEKAHRVSYKFEFYHIQNHAGYPELEILKIAIMLKMTEDFR